MGLSEDIPVLGSAAQRPRQNPQFDPRRHGAFTTEDYYVWSRVDGTMSLRELILGTGFPSAKTIDILQRLRQWGALLLPGEEARPAPAEAASEPGAGAQAWLAPQQSGPTTFELTAEERCALAEDVALDPKEKMRVLAMMRLISRGDHFELLGVSPRAEKRELRRAYFRLSKEFHPDRYYGRKTGSFGPWLATIFAQVSEAFAAVSEAGKRADCPDARQEALDPGRAQMPAEQAAALCERARQRQARGEWGQAARFFAAAARACPHPRYYHGAAECALAAGQWQDAEKYAKKAASLEPDDASCARLLAAVYQAAGRLGDAERALLFALGRNRGNDALTAELKADLARVREGLTR